MTRRRYLLIAAALIVALALILLWMGREPICKCGHVRLWIGTVLSAENSQQIADWYSFSHIIHGFLFYAALWFLLGRYPLALRLCVAIAVEGAWEIFENTDLIINRYRESTIALDYYGDSVLNSVFDTLWMVLGFFLAARLPIWATIALAIGFELFTAYMIRDNLTLNILMLLWPIEAVKAWQSS